MNMSKEVFSNPSPKLNANFISKLSFWWLQNLFWLGKNHELKSSDLYDVLPQNASELLGSQLETSWQEEMKIARKKNKKPRLWKAILKTFGKSLIKFGICMFILNIIKMIHIGYTYRIMYFFQYVVGGISNQLFLLKIRILQPFILALLIWYFNPLSKTTTLEAYIYASGLVFVTLLQTIVVRQAHLGQQEIGMRVRIACSSLIYRKVLKLSCSSVDQVSEGMIINLLSTDLAKFETFFLNVHYIWIMPFIVTLITYLIWRELGVASLVGVSLMMIQIIPIQVFWYRITTRLRIKGAAKTDDRVLLISEIINGIRVIKMHAWEKHFEDMVFSARQSEIGILLQRFYLRSIRLAFAVFTHRLALFCTILVYILQDEIISADKIFSTVQYYVLIRTIMAQFFPEAVSLGAEVNVSMKRIEKFLLLDEICLDTKPVNLKNDESIISMRKVNASWNNDHKINSLHEFTMSVPQKNLYVISGPVGSGKSSILKSILGELQPYSGEIRVSGIISYASQEPWLFAGSVRENIVFGEFFDEERYLRVVKVCALKKDFEQLPFGDNTLVGDRGMCLSGGQCARVNLARAVYRIADIYLLDDPFSAVDTHVSKSLFQDCINDLLKDKTCILITHQTQYLKEADMILFIDNGRVKFQGTFQDLCKNMNYYYEKKYLSSEDETNVLMCKKSVGNAKETRQSSDVTVEKDSCAVPETNEEFLEKGQVAKLIYWDYIKTGSSFFMFSLLVLLFLSTQLSVSGFDYCLSFWTKQEEKRFRWPHNSNNSESEEYFMSREIALPVFGGLVFGIIIFSSMRNFLFYKIILDSNKNLHNNMFTRLIETSIQFFNMNPSGRIINRFSKDTGAIDEILPNALLDVTERVFITVGVIVQILIINWWIIFPMLIMIHASLKIYGIYISTVQDIKRLEGNAKSPLLSLVSSTMLGLLTIRSCKVQEVLRKEFDTRQDCHTAAHNLVMVATSAFSFWLDMISVSFLAVVATSFVFFKDSNTFAGDVGLALTQILTTCGTLQFAMKQAAEFTAQMISVERMFQYTKLIPEDMMVESIPDRTPKKTWPEQGEVKFKNVYLRYSENSKPVLKDLNLTIDQNMKIGVVGRTGAGKSSLVSALFRLAQSDGSITIDNIDTKSISLTELRKRISIIPQEPVIFTTSLRNNLDPLHQHDDASLWSAIRDVKLNKIFDSLDHCFTRGGNNLSIGEKQLLCLARATLKKNKILVLDEVTANVDSSTEELIHELIRLQFKDCSILTISHRLDSIMNCDKVLVMENGEAIEYDQPHILLKQNNSFFSQMVEESGDTRSKHLKNIAEMAFNRELENTQTIKGTNK